MAHIDEYTGPLAELDATLDRMVARLDRMELALTDLRDGLAAFQQTLEQRPEPAPVKRRQPVEAYVLWALTLALTVAGVVGSLV